MIESSQHQQNNNIIEKYCYKNSVDSCIKYGGLYKWEEMMQYNTQQGTQGICPPGWHIPSDEEWKVLEGAVDSQYSIGDPLWDEEAYRGYDAGTNLKSAGGWMYGQNGTDLFGFSGLPGGQIEFGGNFSSLLLNGFWWTSTEYNPSEPWYRYLSFSYPVVLHYYNYTPARIFNQSVRCIKDD